jgi:hypothetical protein
MPRMALVDISSRRWLYLAAKPSHMGVDVDGLANPYTVLWLVAVRQGDRAACQVMSCPNIAVGCGAFPGDAKPMSLDIWWSVDCLDTRATESYME